MGKRNKLGKTQQQLYTEDQVREMTGDAVEQEVVVSKLPDPTEIADWIIKIVTRMLDDDMIELRAKDAVMHQKVLDDEFQQFSNRCYGLFDMTVNMDDPEMLIVYLQQLQRVKLGEISFDEASAAFSNHLDEKHLYPKFSKKQAEEMRQMKKDEMTKRVK